MAVVLRVSTCILMCRHLPSLITSPSFITAASHRLRLQSVECTRQLFLWTLIWLCYRASGQALSRPVECWYFCRVVFHGEPHVEADQGPRRGGPHRHRGRVARPHSLNCELVICAGRQAAANEIKPNVIQEIYINIKLLWYIKKRFPFALALFSSW